MLKSQSVVEAHAQLYHYTTAAGLQGIVETQQLRATNISFLNDVEEHTGFFDRRLPHILEEPIRSAAAEVANSTTGQAHIDAMGGIDNVVAQELRKLTTAIRSATLEFNSPYTTSFCRDLPNQQSDDGLLSQWRGYGIDGGYAIIFETAGIQKLMDEEAKNFNYQIGIWGDVEYYDQDSNQKAANPETLEYERAVQDAIRRYIKTNTKEEFESLLAPITSLSCLHKHRGFKEEAEVRIVAVPANADLFKASQEIGDKRPRKPVLFTIKNGVLVPYIMLFGHESNGTKRKLPISKIIVGPHPDKMNRKQAVELLLEQHGIEATVATSDIPYLGR